jgi:type IV secretion system protein VirB4
MIALTNAGRLKRELTMGQRIPYTAHVSKHLVRTVFGDYVQVFRLAGASFESADDGQLNSWHERLNVLWRNLASPQWALWSHIVRRRASLALADIDRGRAGFAEQLGRAYLEHLGGETLMVNEIYVAMVYRPVAGAAIGSLTRMLDRTRPQALGFVVADASDACEKAAQMLEAALARYEPQRLSIEESGGRVRSQVLEFLAMLVNGEVQPMGVPPSPLNDVLATSRLVFGTEVIEYRMPTSTRLAAILGIKEYPAPSVVGMLNRLLSAPFSFVLTQSFTFLTKVAGQALLQRQYNRMMNAGDFAVSQAEELKAALDALTSSEFVMGDHHCSLQVFAEDVERIGSAAAARRMKALNDHLALARAYLGDAGIIVAREDLALEASYWAQLPGHFAMRARKAPITSRNFAALMPFHNYPVGRAHGNHWGEALTVLITSARSPYYFSLHASDPADPDGGSRKDTGHTFICGPTGSGKTVFVGFLVAMLTRQGATQVIFDKDQGLEILVRALGGTYLPLKYGQATGFNPLQLPIDAEQVEFLKGWLRVLARRPGNTELTTREEADLDQALRGTLALDPGERRLSRLIEFLDATDAEGSYARLAKWCESTRGDYAWVFDQSRDLIAERIEGQALVGFDVTDFLGHEVIRTPVTLYLFHLVRRLLDGRRFVCWMDELWRLLADPAFERFAKDGPKTWRKLNAVMCLATQGAGDVLESPISRTIIEQTPTKVFFPNVDANFAEYVEGFGLTEREFKLVKEQLEPGSRQFLIKQGHHSVVCELDLKGFEGEVKVLSGRASNVKRMRQLIDEFGEVPEAWLPKFLETVIG